MKEGKRGSMVRHLNEVWYYATPGFILGFVRIGEIPSPANGRGLGHWFARRTWIVAKHFTLILTFSLKGEGING